MQVTFVESPYFVIGRAGHYPQGIVIHITENDTLSGLDTWFRDNPGGASAHYGIGRDGTVHQYVKEENVAWHAILGTSATWRLTKPGTSPSYYTIGIEHVGRGHEPWENLKYEASAALIKEICDRWDIPIDRDHIIRHGQVSDTHCPGTQVDMERLVAMARGLPERQYDFIDHPGTVRTRTNVNLREKPTTLASVAGVIPAGTPVSFVGWVTNGLRVATNSYWYKRPDGNYLWAGATKEPNPDLTPVPLPISRGKTTHPLHFRTGPGTHHSSLSVLPVGSPLEILDKQGDWLRVVFGGQEGFVHGGYVQLEGDSPPQPMRTGRTIARLNFRTGPGTHHPSLRVLPVNTHLKILDEEGKWFKVDVDDQEGFVHKDFVDIRGRFILPGFIRSDSPTPGGVRVREIPLEPHISERIDSDHTVANAWNRLGGLIAVLAELLDIEPGVALAVWMVESGGRGFVGGRMVIQGHRLEP